MIVVQEVRREETDTEEIIYYEDDQGNTARVTNPKNSPAPIPIPNISAVIQALATAPELSAATRQKLITALQG